MQGVCQVGGCRVAMPCWFAVPHMAGEWIETKMTQ